MHTETLTGLGLDIREGRFQRGLALIAGLSSVLGTAEVTYEHYRGSFSRRVMYTPLICGTALVVAGVWAFRSRKAARTVLPVVSIITLADSAAGFYFHVRGIQRKPGGWRLPVINIILGPPLFAPLLFGICAYLGLVATFMRRSGDPEERALPRPAHPDHWAKAVTGEHEPISWEQDIREGRFQKHMAAATIVAAFFSGFEALYSHYKNNFKYPFWQATPIVIAPLLMAAAGAAIPNKRVAHTLLPAVSALACADGAVGTYFHARGIVRRPAGLRKPLYNLIWGPPLFAPLLFAASGFVGLLASLLRREERA